jgi:peptide/nickel transport system ATP-binding protein
MHPYTRALVSSVPRAGIPLQGRTILQGEPPNPANRPSGCAFHPRCPLARNLCRIDAPQLKTVGHERTVACHVTAGEDARIAA